MGSGLDCKPIDRETRVQLTSDGHKSYLQAVDQAFGGDLDYAMLVKHYGEAEEPAGRYSPGICTGIEKEAISGSPDPAYISTSYSERSNLTKRMHMRRFTRLTNAFSKKVENHAHSVALHFMAYNFVRVHGSLRCSPAMAADVSNRLWDTSDIVTVIEDWEASGTNEYQELLKCPILQVLRLPILAIAD